MFRDRSEYPVEREALSAKLKEFEQRLGGQKLVAPRIDRDRLMFAAGWEAATRAALKTTQLPVSWGGSRFWPAATATMTAASIALALTLAWSIARSPVPERVIVEAETPAEHKESARLARENKATVEIASTFDEARFLPAREFLDPWRLGDGRVRGQLTARGMVEKGGSDSFVHDMSEPTGSPRKSATARDLLEDLLPEMLRPS